jgi:hypothetical protein
LILTRLFNIGIGPALGVVLAGESLGGTIFPQILVRLIEAEGWRPAMRTLAVLPLLMLAVMPWVLRWVPERRLAAAPTTEAASGRLSVLRFIFQRDVLLLYAAGAALYYAGGGFFAHAFLNFQDRGFAPQAAASCVSLLFITAFAGKGLSGFLAERLGPYRTWLSLQGIFLAGGLLYTLSNAPLVWLGVVLVGVGWGGCYTVTQAVMTTRFVGPSLGRLTGVAVLAEGLAGGLGSWLTGVGFDATGSYQWPFIGLCLSVGLAIALATSLVWRLRPARLATG